MLLPTAKKNVSVRYFISTDLESTKFAKIAVVVFHFRTPSKQNFLRQNSDFDTKFNSTVMFDLATSYFIAIFLFGRSGYFFQFSSDAHLLYFTLFGMYFRGIYSQWFCYNFGNTKNFNISAFLLYWLQARYSMPLKFDSFVLFRCLHLFFNRCLSSGVQTLNPQLAERRCVLDIKVQFLKKYTSLENYLSDLFPPKRLDVRKFLPALISSLTCLGILSSPLVFLWQTSCWSQGAGLFKDHVDQWKTISHRRSLTVFLMFQDLRCSKALCQNDDGDHKRPRMNALARCRSTCLDRSVLAVFDSRTVARLTAFS